MIARSFSFSNISSWFIGSSSNNFLVFLKIFLRGEKTPLVVLTSDCGCKISYEVSDNFKHWVLHTPEDDMNSISIEPYSWITNAPNLIKGKEEAGIIELASGESITFRQEISCASN